MFKLSASYGSHIPLLVDVFFKSSGPVVELGVGYASTPILFWLCKSHDREFISYENDRQWLRQFNRFPHEKRFIKDWSNVEGKYGLVLVDQSPGKDRIKSAAKLKDSDYLILHDSEDSYYEYDKIYPLFKYRYEYLGAKKRHTTVVSNKFDYKFS